MEKTGMKMGVGGATVGALGLALCCLTPVVGLATAAGMGIGIGVWAESVFAALLAASLAFLGFVAWRQAKARRKSPAPAAAGGLPIACDPSVFPKEKRLAHLEQSKAVLLRLPLRKTETDTGFVFEYEGNEDRFLQLAQWLADEHRCCPWGSYAIEAGPSESGKPGIIRVRWGGSPEGKAFLSEALAHLESLGDAAPEGWLAAERKWTRESLPKKRQGACGC